MEPLDLYTVKIVLMIEAGIFSVGALLFKRPLIRHLISMLGSVFMVATTIVVILSGGI